MLEWLVIIAIASASGDMSLISEPVATEEACQTRIEAAIKDHTADGVIGQCVFIGRGF